MYAVKNVKSFRGHDGYGFECTLYCDGKRIGTVLDDAWGGEFQFHLKDGEYEKLKAYAKALPPQQMTYKKGDETIVEDLSPSTETVVHDLVVAFKDNAQFKRQCKKHTLVLLHSGKKGIYQEYTCPFNPNVKKALQDRHGNDLKEIINERFE